MENCGTPRESRTHLVGVLGSSELVPKLLALRQAQSGGERLGRERETLQESFVPRFRDTAKVVPSGWKGRVSLRRERSRFSLVVLAVIPSWHSTVIDDSPNHVPNRSKTQSRGERAS